MFSYLLKRIGYFIPTFFVISLIIFFLSKMAGESLLCDQDSFYSVERCKEEAHQKGYDKPVFYFSLSTAAHPDTLYRIFRAERRSALGKLIGQYGNWVSIQNYYQSLQQLDEITSAIAQKNSNEHISSLLQSIELLYLSYKKEEINRLLKQMNEATEDTLLKTVKPQLSILTQNFNKVTSEATPYRLLIPHIKWYGSNNQYHFWMSKFLRGDFGTSVRDQKPVVDKIMARLPWTLYINIPAILIAYLLAIPLGVYSAVYRGSRFDKVTSVVLLLFYSLPVFWIGTMLVNFLTTPEYGLKIFPSIGLAGPELDWENLSRLILPVFCVTYGALAFMTRQMRSSMLETLQQDYIRTARAKGLSERTVIWKHAFRNSLFPLITIFGAVLPAVFAGSIVVEYIFNITGMGWLLLDSINARDWPVVYAVLMITAILTMLGMLLADLLYVAADPRVRLDKT